MNVFITGDSHSKALQFGARMLRSENFFCQDIQVDVQTLGSGLSLTKPFFTDKGGFAEITELNLRQNLTQLPFASDQNHYDYYGICGPLHASRIWRNRYYWTRYTPFAGQGKNAPVSTNLLRHVVLQQEQYMIQLIELLKRVNVQVFVIEAPKPYRHHPILELVDPKVITYVDEFYRQTIGNLLDRLGVPVISVPSSCYDAEGFMLETYKHDNPADGYHANKQFGAVMIKEVVDFVKAQNLPTN